MGKKLLHGFNYLKSHPQLGMTMLLVLVIPLAFIVSSQQFIDAGRYNQEDLELKRIGMLHDVFGSFAKAVDFESVVIQKEIEHLIDLNPDLVSFMLLRDDAEYLTVIAAGDKSDVGERETEIERFYFANIQKDQSIIQPYAESGIRYWLGYRYVQADDGTVYYIYTQSSLQYIDAKFSARIHNAFYWLAIMLGVVLLLIFRHLKLIDYSHLYKETKKANEMKDMFTNMIAHELRAPLTAMRGYASMIREDQTVSPQNRKYAENIESASSRLVLIVNDLLDVARIQSGKLKMEPYNTNIQPVLTSVLDAMKSNAVEKSITLEQEGSHEPIVAYVDSKRLHQALTNLVSNAIKYTPAGGKITIELSSFDTRVEIRVKDTGMGIDAKNQKKLFAPFFRVQHADVDAVTGTGLGMWITKQLVELMKGSIGVESIKGVGTHIVVTLSK